MDYSVKGQAAVFAPFNLAGKTSTNVQIEYQGIKSPAVNIPVYDALPSLFTANSGGTGQAAALNIDYSYNNSSSPAPRGGVVVLFGTGAGDTTPSGRDGGVSGVGGTVSIPKLPVKAYIGDQEAIVQYFGSAPGLVEGVFQANIVIPTTVPSGDASVVLVIGDKITQSAVTVSVK
jgi:uncharacterized protein (TIGR03437 family)